MEMMSVSYFAKINTTSCTGTSLAREEKEKSVKKNGKSSRRARLPFSSFFIFSFFSFFFLHFLCPAVYRCGFCAAPACPSSSQQLCPSCSCAACAGLRAAGGHVDTSNAGFFGPGAWWDREKLTRFHHYATAPSASCIVSGVGSRRSAEAVSSPGQTGRFCRSGGIDADGYNNRSFLRLLDLIGGRASRPRNGTFSGGRRVRIGGGV